MPSGPELEDLEKRVEEEARKEGLPMEEGKPQVREVKEEKPSSAETKPSVSRVSMSPLEKSELEQVESELARHEMSMPMPPEPARFLSMLDRVPPERLLELLGGSYELRDIIALYILEDLAFSRMMRWAFMHQWLESLQSRKRSGEGLEIKLLEKLIDVSLSQGPDKALAIVRELKDVLAPQQQQSQPQIPGLEELKARIEALERSVAEGRKSPREALQEIKEIIGLVKDLGSLLSTPTVPPSTNTQSPLGYKGHAPWFLHPDARQAIKDLVSTIISSVGNILAAWKMGVPRASPQRPGPSLPEDLRLG